MEESKLPAYRMMELPETTVIGRCGLCTAEHNVVQTLWAEANAHFDEVAALALRDPDGVPTGFWGTMSDESMSFMPWTENFSRGLYLAGVETTCDAQPPEGWTKWTLPARRYLVTDVTGDTYGQTFSAVLQELLPSLGLLLTGAVCDYTEPRSGQNRLFFPVG